MLVTNKGMFQVSDAEGVPNLKFLFNLPIVPSVKLMYRKID